MFKLILIIILSIIIISNSAAVEDLVDIQLIPELPQSYSHKWYSGYLAAFHSESSIYYNFFESQNNPKDDPVLLWLNGGPLCSSLFGLYYENGPFIFLPTSNESIINKFSWNLNANVLYIESPSGVGFSETSNNHPNDTSTSLDSYAALIDFFINKHPEFRQNEFYISGESYAGIYIPFLVHHIAQTDTDHVINLKGFIIGNGCTLGNECTDISEMVNQFSWHQLEQFNNHAFIGFEDWESFTQNCNEQNFAHIPECSKQAASMVERFSFNYFDINNLKGKCYHHIGGQLNSYKKHQLKKRINFLHSQFPTIKHFQKQKHNILLDGVCDFEVGDFYLLNLDHVRQALHIKQFVRELRWQTCSLMNYNENRNGSFFIYPKLLNLGLRIWIYSGDVDANVPITGTLKWLHKLKEQHELSEVEEWRPWFVVGNRQGEFQVGGMTWGFDKLRFASVRGAGHEVPFWEPMRALTLIQAFLNNNQLPSV